MEIVVFFIFGNQEVEHDFSLSIPWKIERKRHAKLHGNLLPFKPEV